MAHNGYTFHMEAFSVPSGSLVSYAGRPGVWRCLGIENHGGEVLAVIEPWDDLAAGSFHASEAYSVTVPHRLLHRLRPGSRSTIDGDRGGRLVTC